MTKEEAINLFTSLNANNAIKHKIIEDEDFLEIVSHWIDVIQDSGLCWYMNEVEA